jgi:hypothetical protein
MRGTERKTENLKRKKEKKLDTKKKLKRGRNSKKEAEEE